MTIATDALRSAARSALWLALALPLAGAAQAGEPYRLGISDKLHVKVVQWKAAESDFAEWGALGGDYVVGADGNVNFPMVGPTEGAGRTSAELGAQLGSALQQALGLATAPTVTVEIAEYGPFYVSGDVGAPGEYKYAPNLTVVKALALAGGERGGSQTMARPEREMLTTTGALDVLEDEYRRLLVRRARLDAALAGKDTITLPAEVEGSAPLDDIVASETAILAAQKRQLDSQSRSLSDQAALLGKQIESFRQKQANTERQLLTARDQFEKITTLSDDGLALNSRVASLQTNVSDLESRLLDSQTAAMQAQQDIAAAERERARLSDQRLADLSLERQTVDGQIAALKLKIATQKGLVQEAAMQTGAEIPGETQAAYRYAIIRDGKEIPAEINTPVVAGDVVVARLVLARPD